MNDEAAIDAWLEKNGILEHKSKLKFDRKIRRFSRNPKKPGDKSAFIYGLALNFRRNRIYRMIFFGDWATGERDRYTTKFIESNLEKKKIRELIHQASELEVLERTRFQKETSEKADWIFSQCVESEHPYLSKKQVCRFGTKVSTYKESNSLVVPVCNFEGKIVGLQFIPEEGPKKFLPGTQKKGNFFLLGDLSAKTETVLVSEGFATGASVHMATDLPVFVAFDSGNLVPVANLIREKYHEIKIVIAGDDDRSNPHNPGRKKALEAAKEVKGCAVFPAFTDEESNSSDFNDLHVSHGIERVKECIFGQIERHENRIENAVKIVSEFSIAFKDGKALKLNKSELEALDLLERDSPPHFEQAKKSLRKLGFMKEPLLGLLAQYQNQKLKESYLPIETELDESKQLSEAIESGEEQEALVDVFLESSGYLRDSQLLIRYFKGSIYKYNGKHYHEIPNHDFEAEVSAWLLNEQLTEIAGKTLRNNLIADIQGKILLPYQQGLNSWINGSKGQSECLLNCDNGILDLKKLFDRNPAALVEHTPNFFSTSVLPFKFEEFAQCPTWDKIIREILPDEGKLRLLQQWFGYSLTDDVSYHKFMILLGSGANGKSVVCTVLRTLLGKDNVSSVPLESFRSDRQFNLAELNGRKANIVEEISAKDCDKVSVGLLKDIVAGGEVQVQKKFKNPFSMRSKAKLLFATNEMPNFSDTSEGLWRRLFVIVFDRQVLDEAKQDKRLTKPEFWRESGELSGILSWAITGLFDIFYNGFSETEESKKIKIELKNAVSFEADFIKSNLCEAPGSQIGTKDLFRKYEDACREEQIDPVKVKEFSSQVRAIFPKAQISKNAFRKGKLRYRAWIGIKLQSESSPKHELNPSTDLLSLNEIRNLQENLKSL